VDSGVARPGSREADGLAEAGDFPAQILARGQLSLQARDAAGAARRFIECPKCGAVVLGPGDARRFWQEAGQEANPAGPVPNRQAASLAGSCDFGPGVARSSGWSVVASVSRSACATYRNADSAVGGYAAPPRTRFQRSRSAALAAELDLYRIDLAGVVSKYIGETEKNLCLRRRPAERAHQIG
jgi:hypothetical protein